MRAPGILGWERESDFVDWRAETQKLPSSTSTASALSTTSSSASSSSASSSSSSNPAITESWHHHHHQNHRRRDEDYHRYRSNHESRSTERYGAGFYSRGAAEQLLLSGGHDKSTSGSVDAWAEEVRAASERRSTSSSRSTTTDGSDSHTYSSHGKLALFYYTRSS